MLDDFTFDYAKFYKDLLAASRQGFQLLKDRFANEKFYCFAFYSHGSHSFIYTVASTEEGLTRVAQRYIDEYPERYGKAPLEEMRVDLRHSIADSPLNKPELVMPFFTEICDVLDARHEALFNIWSNLFDEYGDKADDLVEPHKEQFLNTCFAVLNQLDIEGMFGTGQVRDQVILNFLMGDQSEHERLTYAAAVNPQHIVKTYEDELQAGWAIAGQIHQRWMK